MKAVISKSNIRGSVSIPASKSMTIRALMCAALSSGRSEIINPLISEDTNAAASVLTQIGADIQKGSGVWKVIGSKLHATQKNLHCGESAATLRFMTAICSLIPGRHRLVGGPSLSTRPVGLLVDVLRKLGVKISADKSGTLPVEIEGGTFQGGTTEIPGNVSSQFISALLLASPLAQKDMTIKLTTPLTSQPYVEMTLWCLKQFGIDVKRKGDEFIITPQKYVQTSIEMESDWSSASYFLALGALSDEGIIVRNLNSKSLQGDRVMLDFLRKMGAKVKARGSEVTISHHQLKGIRADLSNCIDLLPTIAVLATLAKGTTELTAIRQARLKESNRVVAIREGLNKLGITASEEENRLTIKGGLCAPPKPVVINSYNDHRIAMAFSVLGAAYGNIVIDGAECVAKTFPTYWDEFRKIGGEVKLNE
jgi:3-phosphoshikimate 1-carboxyvinyltransferase